MRYKKAKQASGGIFISPQSAGSFISWQLSLTPSYKFKRKDPATKKDEWKTSAGYLSGTIRLGDCTRQIGWDFGTDKDDNTRKVDMAIKELQNFRKKLVQFNEELSVSRKQTGYNSKTSDEYGL